MQRGKIYIRVWFSWFDVFNKIQWLEQAGQSEGTFSNTLNHIMSPYNLKGEELKGWVAWKEKQLLFKIVCKFGECECIYNRSFVNSLAWLQGQ